MANEDDTIDTSSVEDEAKPRKLRNRKPREASAGPSPTKRRKLPANSENGTPADSREGSCEGSQCENEKECSVQLSAACVNTSHSVKNRPKANFCHLNSTEHICQVCYEELLRTGRTANFKYVEWKKRWINECRCAPTLKIFALDVIVPCWMKCRKCAKFRKVEEPPEWWTTERAEKFDCSQAKDLKLELNPCKIPENEKVAVARNIEWIQSASAPTFLHNSPAMYYLKDEYYCDEVGMSPQSGESNIEYETEFMFPFNIPNKGSVAFCVRPDGMEFDELEKFSEFCTEPVPYLALRNLVVAVWALNPFQYVTYERCLNRMICRGLARVWYATQLKRVYEFLCLKNIINHGILPFPSRKLLKERTSKDLEVIVVGAGISGLTVARQLQSFGAKVKILEASGRAGGRMRDDFSLGVAVGCGAQLVTGVTNSPIILMCEQVGTSYRPLSDECPLMDSFSGKVVTPAADRVVDEHFNCILDSIGEWRRVTKATTDTSLQTQMQRFHTKLMKALPIEWTPEYDRLLHWQFGNIEFSCGASIRDVSARNWDQNEAVGQFAGDHAFLNEGSKYVIDKLASTAEIVYYHPVTKVEYGQRAEKVTVHCEYGRKFTADKVVMCLPLAVLQKDVIRFSPPLPEAKQNSLRNLGAGIIEKIAVKFKRRFWDSLLKTNGTLDYFGNVPKDAQSRGMFNMFYDFSSRRQKTPVYVLMSYVCGDAAVLVNQKTDAEVAGMFVDALRDLFPDEDIPEPEGYVVTHWGRDPFIGMSYSYVRVNGDGKDYDNVAAPIGDKVYFAGESTNRFFPQTMMGAYVSGLREAGRIVSSWIKAHPSTE